LIPLVSVYNSLHLLSEAVSKHYSFVYDIVGILTTYTMPTFEEPVAAIPPHYETTYESFIDNLNDANQNGNISSEPVEPIALVGMAMRLPGSVHNADEFWQLLAEKRSGLCEVPKDRFNVEGFQDPSGKPGTFKMSKGYYLQDVDIKQFDTSFFSLSKTELERLDPQQRQLLEIAYECMEDAGATSWRGSNIGCYVGVFGEDWQDLNAKETQHRGGYRVTGYGDFVLANRISYEFDLHGPRYAIAALLRCDMIAMLTFAPV
jgi:hypothetical protein